MNSSEAGSILRAHLAQYAQRGYSELVLHVNTGAVATSEVLGASGTRYQLEIECVWDRKPGGGIRILGSIDDGGLRAFVPLSRSELIAAPIQ
jgi:hypothetical protein